MVVTNGASAVGWSSLLCMVAMAMLASVVEANNNLDFKHFVPNNDTHTCTADAHATPFNNQIRGVNLGGWMVLEPWITPSLFYQFLGKDETTTATDIYSFCKVLGPEEGNRQLRRHWETWVTEEIIEELASNGAVNSLRLPVGDFMYKPYGPYVGCTDGALEYVEQLFEWAHSRGLTVLIDIHAVRGSQNGFDNSGQSQGFEWTSILNTEPAGLVTFEHWPIRTAEWMGTFDRVTGQYTDINRDNIQHALDVIAIIVDLYADHPMVLGIEPVNEPWQYTPLDELKQFYWDGYLLVKRRAPYWKFIMHDSFRFDVATWGGFMDGCPDRALDTHIYQAWMDPASRITFYADACQQKNYIAEMEREFGPVIVGEWSLATDNCAMWLNGFNDNLPGFPRLPCKYIPCSEPYMGTEQPGTPVDPGKPIQGPYGTGMSGPIYGLCPVGRDWLRESSGNIKTGTDYMHAPPAAPPGHDDSDDVMRNLANKKIAAFSGIGHGFYFWNFRTDVVEPHWSYMLAVERGWITKGNLDEATIMTACEKEDTGQFLCVAKRNQLDKTLRPSVASALQADGTDDTSYLNKLSGEDLCLEGDRAFNDVWQAHRVEGATCDFGGVAELISMNRTNSIDDDMYTDDFYSPKKKEDEEEIILKAIALVLGGIVLGSIFGCFVALRFSKKFRRTVSTSDNRMIRNISHSKAFRSFGGYHAEDYSRIPNTQISMS